MVRHTLHYYLFILSILTVILQLEFISSSKIKSGRRDIWFQWFLNSHKNLKLDTNTATIPSKDVPGFSLSEDEMRKFNIWPDGFIPYYIDVTSFSDKVLRDKIRSYLNMINSITSLNFVELPNPPEDDHTRWVFFINRKGLLGCADHSVWDFTSEGVQRVVLGYDCMNKEGELPEAVLAIAGVPAQHTAPDRDEYIEVFEDNVIPDKRKLFEKLSNSDWLFHDLPYDYNSVGHFHNFKYSVNGKTVIQPRNPDITIGETKELSEIDILKIRLLYNFITQQKQLDVPDCQKLFKTGSKFNRFVPDKNIAKPKRKPAKYTGDQPNINSDVEYIDDEKPLSGKQSVENVDDETPLSEKQSVESVVHEKLLLEKQSIENVDDEKPLSGKQSVENVDDEKPSSGKQSAENVDDERPLSEKQSVENVDDGKLLSKKQSVEKVDDEKMKIEKLQKNYKKDIQSAFSDNHSEIELLKFKIKTDGKDPLEYFSDYTSDQDAKNRINKIAKEKQQTLKQYVGRKVKSVSNKKG